MIDIRFEELGLGATLLKKSLNHTLALILANSWSDDAVGNQIRKPDSPPAIS